MVLSDFKECEKFVLCEIPYIKKVIVRVTDKAELLKLAKGKMAFQWLVFPNKYSYLDWFGLMDVDLLFENEEEYPIVSFYIDGEPNLERLKDCRHKLDEVIHQCLFEYETNIDIIYIPMDRVKILNESLDFLKEFKKIYNGHRLIETVSAVRELLKVNR